MPAMSVRHEEAVFGSRAKRRAREAEWDMMMPLTQEKPTSFCPATLIDVPEFNAPHGFARSSRISDGCILARELLTDRP